MIVATAFMTSDGDVDSIELMIRPQLLHAAVLDPPDLIRRACTSESTTDPAPAGWPRPRAVDALRTRNVDQSSMYMSRVAAVVTRMST